MAAGGLVRAGYRVLRLPARERRQALEAAAEVTRASIELRMLPSRRTVGLLGTLEREEPGGGAPRLEEARRLGRDVERAARRLPWHPTCLRQALAAQRMLRRRGIPSRLHLGVSSAGGGAAHAWITVAGQPVVGRPGVERFVPLAAFA